MADQLSLFENQVKPSNIPLAEQVRPRSIADLKGQQKLLQPGGLLHNMLQQDNYSSFIMWGPPGTGKTTIARIIERHSSSRFISFSAVLAGIKDVKAVMQEAEFTLKEQNKSTLLFIDEIHRFNKAQQDAFLPYIESGAVILIGATTENPSFEIIPALLSRCRVLVLEQLAASDIRQIIQRGRDFLPKTLHFSQPALDFLVAQSSGDGRKALNNLQNIADAISGEAEITLQQVSDVLARRALYYDKAGEEHYNLISALHKSLRGSDAQAGLYWLARMLEAGEDPLYIVRRLVRFATEDIGLADPNAVVQAVAIKDACKFLGMPESNTALAQLVVYLATAPKSNSAYAAYKKAAKDAVDSSRLGVPLHIRNAPTKLLEELDYGKDYHYDHEAPEHYIYQDYFPQLLGEQTYYYPSKFGFEKEIQKRLDWWQKLKEKQKNIKKD
ncbi:MAG: replication-associated recombination protein A [Candidatus Cloacimonadales bacterium]